MQQPAMDHVSARGECQRTPLWWGDAILLLVLKKIERNCARQWSASFVLREKRERSQKGLSNIDTRGECLKGGGGRVRATTKQGSREPLLIGKKELSWTFSPLLERRRGRARTLEWQALGRRRQRTVGEGGVARGEKSPDDER